MVLSTLTSHLSPLHSPLSTVLSHRYTLLRSSSLPTDLWFNGVDPVRNRALEKTHKGDRLSSQTLGAH